MDVHEIISDVARARVNLAELASDETVTPERLAKCEKAADDLEAIVSELWPPTMM